MNELELKCWADELWAQLEAHRDKSKGALALYDYRDLMDALEKARVGAVHAPIRLPALGQFIFETDIPSFRPLAHALSCFTLLLEAGRQSPSEFPADIFQHYAIREAATIARKSMNKCPWEPVAHFSSRSAYDNCFARIYEDILRGHAVDMPVMCRGSKEPLHLEKWYCHVPSGTVWRLVWPSGPFEQIVTRSFQEATLSN